MDRKSLILLICTLLIFSITGCSNDSNIKDNEMDTVEYFEIPSMDYEMHQYNLGESIITQEYGPDMPYDMIGSIAYPSEGGDFPVVFVLHGSFMFEDYNAEAAVRGMDYLLESLAQKGFLAISFNNNAQYTWEDGYGEPVAYERLISIYQDIYENLDNAISGDESIFGLDLTNKGDMSQIAFIGHSRGGLAIDELVNVTPTEVFASIKIAPSSWIAIDNPNPDIPTAIIQPQLDGDLRDFHGQYVFDELMDDSSRESFSSVVMLEGASHNLFNKNVELDDRQLYQLDGFEEEKLISAEEHQNFLTEYCGEFLYKSLGKNIETHHLNSYEGTQNKVYGLDAKTSLIYGNRLDLINGFEESTSVNAIGDENKIENLTVNYFTKSNIPVEDELPLYSRSGRGQSEVLGIHWDTEGAEFTLFLPEENKDISIYDSLSFYMMLDLHDEKNIKGQNQGFSVVLTDTNGNESSVTIDDAKALEWPDGEYVRNQLSEDFAVEYWSIPTNMGGYNIPLNSFDVDLTDIDNITLRFDQSEAGAILIKNISLQSSN